MGGSPSAPKLSMSKQTSLKNKALGHPLVRTLVSLKGNPRVLVLIEPLWGIPNSLIAPFTAIYMRAMGVDNLQIGFALSAAMAAQVVCAFFGGIVADKLGRKLTTVLGDFIGWVVPCAIWAAAQNYWFFLAAMVLNSFEQVNQTAWVCLLVEDAEEKDILHMWNWIMIAGLVAVFFSPISGVLINAFSLVPLMRVLYGSYALTMLVKCLITLRYTTETRQGKLRREQTKRESVLSMALGYWRLVPRIFKDADTLRVLAVMVVLSITGMVSQNFYSLYVTSGLNIPENYLAYFPIIRAVIMLLFFFVIQHRLEKYRTKVPMQLGLILYMLCQAILVFSPPDRPLLLVLYTLLEAVAFGIIIPRKELMSAVFINKQERARIMALLTTITIAIAMPFGGITGALSKLDGRLPFVLSFVCFLFMFATIRTMKKDPGPELEESM